MSQISPSYTLRDVRFLLHISQIRKIIKGYLNKSLKWSQNEIKHILQLSCYLSTLHDLSVSLSLGEYCQIFLLHHLLWIQRFSMYGPKIYKINKQVCTITSFFFFLKIKSLKAFIETQHQWHPIYVDAQNCSVESYIEWKWCMEVGRECLNLWRTTCV